MSCEMKTYTKKQAGVIYSAVKRGDVEAPKSVISEMYDLAGCAEIFSEDMAEHIQDFVFGIKHAIDSIFANDYEEATKTLASLA